MSTKIKTTQASQQIDTPLLDRMLQANKERSKSEGVDIDALSEANPLLGKLRGENHRWEDLEKLDETIVGAIVERTEMINGTYQQIVEHKVDHPQELDLAIKTFMSDMDAATDDVLTIRKQYENREGPLNPKKDLVEFTRITTDYLVLQDRVKQLVLPVALTLSEVQLDIQQKINELKRQEEAEQDPALDPAVVTDVEFKESK